jgi:hypothetical protein
MSTSINELPTDPTIGGSQEQPIITNTIPNNSFSLDQTTINQIVNGLQQASVTGATTLPSRDIPQNTNTIIQDEQIKPNYIPQNVNTNTNVNDYIMDEPITINYKEQQSIDNIYDELQTPILISLLYFIFQLPIFKRTIYKNFAFFCNNDGNYNINGLLFVSLLFGSTFYFLSKFMNHFSKF